MSNTSQFSPNLYHIDGIDDALTIRVCAALKAKWRDQGDETINLPNMIKYFKTDEVTLTKIISWYEGQLLCTKFKIIS